MEVSKRESDVAVAAAERQRKSLQNQAYSFFKAYVVLVLTIHPTFHYCLALLPDPPPDSLALRVAATFPFLVGGVLCLLFPSVRKHAEYLSVIGTWALLGSVHQLVIDSGNHYLYLSSALLGVFGAQFAFGRIFPLALAFGSSFATFLLLAWWVGSSLQTALFSVAYFGCAYAISVTMALTRIRAQTREFRLRLTVSEQEKALQEEKARGFQQAKLATLGVMAGGVAHEINSPLAIIKVSCAQIVELIEEDGLNRPLIQQKLLVVDRTIDRIAKIISGLRSFSREGGGEEGRKVGVEALLEEALCLCRERFKNSGVNLEVKPVDPALFVQVRPTEISQILLNLLNNSFDAVFESKENVARQVSVSVSQSRGFVEITVSDNGSGISAEARDKIFQPFFTTKDIGKGMGLGLSISKGIAESHGGSLVLSESSVPTCFVLRLPAASPS